MSNPVLPGAPPTLQRVTVSAPAAGAEWSYTVPASNWVRLNTGYCTFTTSATVAARYFGVKFSDPSGFQLAEVVDSLVGATTPASIVQQFMYAHSFKWDSGGTCAVANITAMIEWAPVIFPPGYVFGSATANLQAADQFSAVELWLETWTASPLLDGGTLQI